MKIMVHSDGGARGNPGPAAIGVMIAYENGESLAKLSEYIGETTNNVAEYTAVLRGLDTLIQLLKDNQDIEIDWKLDSELVVKQLAGEYKVKNPDLRTLHQKIQDKRAGLPRLTFSHVRREENMQADRLVNEALDQELK